MYRLHFLLLMATEVTSSLSETTGRFSKVNLYQKAVDPAGDPPQSEVTVLVNLPASSRQSRRSRAYTDARVVRVLSETELAVAYQAHVCHWNCLRNNATRLFPEAALNIGTFGVSCIYCFCDEACSRFGDCCGRFGEIDDKINDPPMYECLKVNEDHGVYVIRSCPGGINSPATQQGQSFSNYPRRLVGGDSSEPNEQFEIRQKCDSCSNESVSLITVADKTYCNEHCLQCNEGRSVQPSDLIWRNRTYIIQNIRTEHRLEHEQPEGAVVRECDARWKSLKAADNCSTTNLSSAVNVTQEYLDLFKRLCESYRSPVNYGFLMFDNIFCYLYFLSCGQKKKISLSLLTDLSRQFRTAVPRGSGGDDKINEGATIRVDKTNAGSEEFPCAPGHARFQEKGECRKIHCTDGNNATQDVETSQWMCVTANLQKFGGFRLNVAWHVLGRNGVPGQARHGDTRHETSKEMTNRRHPHTGNRHSSELSYKNTTEYKKSGEGRGNPAASERVNLSFPQTPRKQFIPDHVASGEQTRVVYDHLANQIRKFACESMASHYVTRFCLKSCWRERRRNATGSGGYDVVCDYNSGCVMNDSGNNSQNIYRIPQPEVTNQNLTSHTHKKTQPLILPRRNMAVTSLPPKQGRKSHELTNNGCQWRIGKKRKHKVGSNMGVEKPEVTSEIIVIFGNTTDIDDLQKHLLTQFLGTKQFHGVNFSTDVDASLGTGSLDGGAFSWDMDDQLTELTAVSACAHVKFNASEVKKSNDGKLVLPELNVTLRRFQYFHESIDTILICVSTLNVSDTAALPEEGVTILENILTWASLSVSFLCLFITLATYAAIPVLRTLPGKNNMILVIYLILAQAMLIAADFTEKGTLMCQVMGAALHYSWLTAVVWMSACSFHMFHVFVVRQGAPSSDRTHWYYLLRYLVFTQFVSLTIVMVVVISSLYASSWKNPGYGREVCYLDTALLVALGFILPLAIAVLTNIGLFSLTIYTISRLEQVKRHSKREQKNVHIYLRLSVLTGVTWSLALVAEIPGLGALRFVSIVVNGSQGVFLFVSYICNRRVWNLWRNVFSNARISMSVRTSRNITSTTYVQ